MRLESEYKHQHLDDIGFIALVLVHGFDLCKQALQEVLQLFIGFLCETACSFDGVVKEAMEFIDDLVEVSQPIFMLEADLRSDLLAVVFTLECAYL